MISYVSLTTLSMFCVASTTLKRSGLVLINVLYPSITFDEKLVFLYLIDSDFFDF